MKSTNTKIKRSPGRPKTTGAGTPMVVRVHKSQLQALDKWIARQEDELSRPEAIRRMMNLVLSGLPAVGRRAYINFSDKR